MKFVFMKVQNKAAKSVSKKATLTSEQREAKKRLAFVLYTENGLEQKVIAEITGISENSISAWKKEGNWEDEREQARLGPEMEMRRMRKMLNEHLDTLEKEGKFPDSKEADAIHKITAAVKNLMGEQLLLMHKTAVGKKFVEYIQETYGQARAVEIVELWHEWIMTTT